MSPQLVMRLAIRLIFLMTITPVSGSVADEVTFNRNVAPILLEHCATCHRPGQSGPFSLLSYSDARKRARQIVSVTRDRFMPPWLPKPGSHRFVGDRRLSDKEIDIFAQWVAGGMAEGDPEEFPVAPKWPEGWQLGRPDLVLEMVDTYELAADGPDVFRSFVIEVPILSPRYVKAVELRPGNPKIIHHAIMFIDRSKSARRLDAEDDEPGYDGMRQADIQAPGGRFIGWTPGKVPLPARDQMAWRLDPGSDLILELHMLPSGKPEQVQGSIGLFFTEKAPSRQSISLLFYNKNIDIAAGESNYGVEESYVVPVDTLVMGIYPHAHYLGKHLEVFASLPGGDTLPLIEISDWDFNWQDDYRYEDPVLLPKGAVVFMRYRYDNSSENVRNPNIPPIPVRQGNRSTDEMATLTLEVMTRNPEEQGILQSDYEGYLRRKRIIDGEKLLIDDPENIRLRVSLAMLLVREDNLKHAVSHLERAVNLDPSHATAGYWLGLVLQKLGRNKEAVSQYRQVLNHHPGHIDTHSSLANVLSRIGQNEVANRHRQQAAKLTVVRAEEVLNNLDEFLRKFSDQPVRLYNLAVAMQTVDRHAEAITLYEKAIEIQRSGWRISAGVPDFMLHHNFAEALLALKRVDAAIDHFQKAIEYRPDHAQTYVSLANALQTTGRMDEAMAHYRRAVDLAPDLVPARFNYAMALQVRNRLDEATVQLREILAVYPDLAIVHYHLGETLTRMGRQNEAKESYGQALRRAAVSGDEALMNAARDRLSIHGQQMEQVR